AAQRRPDRPAARRRRRAPRAPPAARGARPPPAPTRTPAGRVGRAPWPRAPPSSRVEPPRLERRRNLADPGDERRLAKRQPSLLVELPDPLEGVAELVLEPGADLVTAPEQAAEVLYPLEVRDGDAARVRQHVRQHRDAARGEDRVRLERRRPVRALGDEARRDARGVLL